MIRCHVADAAVLAGAAGIVAGVAGTLLVGLGIWFIWRRRAPRRTSVARSIPQAPAPPISENPPAAPFISDRRSAIRRGGRPFVVWISNSEGTAEPYRGWIIDRSSGGICLWVDRDVPPGSVLGIRPANDTANAVPWIQLEVRNQRKTGTSFKLGCKFVHTPTLSVLLALG